MKRLLLTITLIIALLGTMATQMVLLAHRESATYDEPIHILSGYATDKFHHALFDPEHPFLIKAIAAIPLLFMHPNYPQYAQQLSATQRDIHYNILDDALRWGDKFLYLVGNNADQLLFAARLPMIVLTLLLGLVIFLWTKHLFGLASGLSALALFAFDPSFIAHGMLVNDDVAATLLFLLGLMTFYRFLRQPSWPNTLIAGLTFGLALLTKFSLLILGPVYVVIFILWQIGQKYEVWGMRYEAATPSYSMLHTSYWRRHTAGLFAIFLIAWLTIWTGYGTLHLINPSENPLTHPTTSGWMGQIITDFTPGLYAKGAISILPTPSTINRTGYLLGACYTGGRWDYFPVLLLFKTPLPTLILFAIGIALLVLSIQHPASSRTKDENTDLHTPYLLPYTPYAALFILLPALIFLIFSAFSNLNIGFRHILPVYALFLIIASYPARFIEWNALRGFGLRVTGYGNTPQPTAHNPYPPIANRQRLAAASLLLLLVASAVTAFRVFPNDLPYFNALAGEPRPLPYIAYDSNVDWGQSLKQLQWYMQDHHITTIALDNYNGYVAADYYSLHYTIANPTNHSFHGYLAISRSKAIDRICKNQPNWNWLTNTQKPITMIGNAIDIYKVE